ncbi:Clp1/GlmU family protein [Pyrococcus sp. ST04]|uniref:Clp1/GlmU family protein n=1 Tax=Pyrococcus sp. ST04 TaxID=1183377 RepID=UPI00026059BA|nr:Clp1/GlmU family protein [Pyrococcus sp. ST04]AFK21867.1 putative Polyribonucleotide 5'-hydroxyl-kinase PYRAB01840 [Pyrococcus sp. ST04]
MEVNKAVFTQDVPQDRIDAIRKILDLKKPAKIMIIGDIDTGKTTLTVYLANELISNGLRVAIVDADIGQKGILPPATISLAFVDSKFSSLDELTPYVHYFVGSITPNQFFGEMVVGTSRLTEIGRKLADVVLIDTTGMIYGSGVELKRLKIENVKPDLILALEKEGELGPIIRGYEDITVKLEVSEKARLFSRNERRAIRKEKWRRYFENSQLRSFSLSEVNITGTSIFQGKPIGNTEKSLLERLFKWVILHGRKIGDKYFVVKADVTEGPRVVDKNVVRYFDFSKLGNLLVGLLDREGLCLGIGILKGINFSEGRVDILTPVKDENVHEIRFGRIRVREDGEELGLLDRDAL